MRIVHLMC